MATFNVGDKVIYKWRLPVAHQWWLGPIWVGEILPITDDNTRGGSWSDREYAERTGSVIVRYSFGDQWETAADLRPAPFDSDRDLSHADYPASESAMASLWALFAD